MTTSEDLRHHAVWSWVTSGNCWVATAQGTRDEMIIALRMKREAASRVIPGGARFVMTEPGQSPDQAYANDPAADMPPPVRAEPPSAPGPWEPGYQLTDAEAAEVLRASADREEISRLRAEVAGLRARLDFYEGRNVVHCMERSVKQAMHALRDEADGTLLRATDTGCEWELRAGIWLTR